MTSKTLHPRTRILQGFSLPEATISIGIAALGLTSVLGFLPQGLNTLKKAADISTETRISQQIISNVTNAEWVDAAGQDLLTRTYQGRRYYFDDLAVELDARDPGPYVAYVAEVEMPVQDVSLPAVAQTSAGVDPYLRRVEVKVTNAASTAFDFSTAQNSSYRTYASVVTRSGR